MVTDGSLPFDFDESNTSRNGALSHGERRADARSGAGLVAGLKWPAAISAPWVPRTIDDTSGRRADEAIWTRADNPALLGDLPDAGIGAADVVADLDAGRSGR